MARNRKSQTNTEGNGKTMAGLTNDQILALLAKTRTKGEYVVLLNEFLASGEAGVCANDTWPQLAQKKATTLKQGFENAKENKEASEGADKVIVKSDEDRVYLINVAHVEGASV